MNTQSMLVSTAISGLLALGLASGAIAADDKANQEKCYGIAKAGNNSCAANGHGCQGQAKTDNDPNEWLYVTKGQCAQQGGSTTPGKKAS